jgi:hypothetical protein
MKYFALAAIFVAGAAILIWYVMKFLKSWWRWLMFWLLFSFVAYVFIGHAGPSPPTPPAASVAVDCCASTNGVYRR